MSTTPPDRPGVLSPKPTGRPPANRRKAKRPQRIRDYEQEVLNDPDALAANLGAVNADLMWISYRLGKVTRAALARSTNPLEDLAGLLPAINASAQVARQIHRLAEFDSRQRGGAANGAPAASRKQLPQVGDGSGTAPSEEQST